jgi:hypothetical protein
MNRFVQVSSYITLNDVFYHKRIERKQKYWLFETIDTF